MTSSPPTLSQPRCAFQEKKKFLCDLLEKDSAKDGLPKKKNEKGFFFGGGVNNTNVVSQEKGEKTKKESSPKP